jgi:nucleoside-diphosphate-sugar epimerase
MPQTNWPKLHEKTFAGASVLVTGGAGFIGSHLVEALTILGAKVVVLDDLSGGSLENIAPFGARFVRGSILDEPVLGGAMAGCKFVFHLAALGSVPQSVEQPRKYHDANATGTLNVLEAARKSGVARVIYSASSSAYGDAPGLPKVETMPPAPCSPYAATKLAGEALLACYSASYRLDTISLRYFNIFGPRQNANSAYAAVIAAFAKALLSGQPPMIFGDGEQSRDFTFVENAVHSNLLGASSAKPLNGEVVNVACGKSVTVVELAHAMAAGLGRPDLKPKFGPERAGDVKHSLADMTKARALLGYEPLIGLEAGLKPTLEWYRQAALGR